MLLEQNDEWAASRARYMSWKSSLRLAMIHRPARGRCRGGLKGGPSPHRAQTMTGTLTTSRDAIEVPRTGKGTLPPEGARAFAWNHLWAAEQERVFPICS